MGVKEGMRGKGGESRREMRVEKSGEEASHRRASFTADGYMEEVEYWRGEEGGRGNEG